MPINESEEAELRVREIPRYHRHGAHSSKIARGGAASRIYFLNMEPAEKFIRRLLKFVLMILAFIVSIVFGEYRGMGWVGVLIFVIGAAIGGLGTYLWKTLKD